MFVKASGNLVPGGQRVNTAGTEKFCSKLIFFKHEKFIVISQRKPNIKLNRLNLSFNGKTFFSLSTAKFNDYNLK